MPGVRVGDLGEVAGSQLASFADVGHVAPIGDAVDVVALGDDVGLADLLRPPAQFGHAILDRACAQPLGGPALHQLFYMLGFQALRLHVHETHFPQLVGDQREDAFPVGLGGKAAVPIAGTELLQFVVQGLHRPLGRGGSLRCCRCLFRSGQCFCPSHRAWAGRDLQGTSGHHSRLCRLFCCWPPRHAVLGVDVAPCGESLHRFEPLTQGSWGRRGGAS